MGSDGVVESNPGENFTCHLDCSLIPSADPREEGKENAGRGDETVEFGPARRPEAVLDSRGEEDGAAS